MRDGEIRVGSTYLALASGWLCPFRVIRRAFIFKNKWECENRSTGCVIQVTPGVLRRELSEAELAAWLKRNDGVRFRRRYKQYDGVEGMVGSPQAYEDTFSEEAADALPAAEIREGAYYLYTVPPTGAVPILCLGASHNGGWHFRNLNTGNRIYVRTTGRIRRELSVAEMAAWLKMPDGRSVQIGGQAARGPRGSLLR
jgi:hypothetical protein